MNNQTMLRDFGMKMFIFIDTATTEKAV